MKKLALILALCFFNTNSEQNIKTTYNFTPDPIDVVFPCHEKDKRTIELAVQGIRENGKNIRRIIVVSEKKLTNIAEWQPESIYPFTKNDIALAVAHGDESVEKQVWATGRVGWIYQQFLKMYAPLVIKDISPNVLIIDADAIFLNPVEFMNEKGEPYFSVGTEHHRVYFEHCAKLLDEPFTIKKMFPNYPGICHHMLMQKPVLEDLFERVEKKHGKKFWEACCSLVNLKEVQGSCMADYEIYFNFIISRTNQARIRLLKWTQFGFRPDAINQCKKQGYHHISFHTYLG